MGKIGIAITTRNRPEAFLTSVAAHNRYNPDQNYIVVNDAGEPTSYDDYRFKERVGIPRAKNKCLELLMDRGCENMFLFDDDTYPKSKKWWEPYVNSPYKHLCYTFGLPHWKDETHKYHLLGNGCMLYIHRDVVDRIGGFDTAFGLGKFEHTQFSHRAYAAGFSPSPFVDVVGSGDLFYSMDRKREVQRSFTEEEMEELLKKNGQHYVETIRDTSFYPYR